MNRKKRFAIVGCGNIGNRHALAATNYGKLIAVADTDTRKAIQFSRQFNCPYFDSFEQILSLEDKPDIISICTPNWLHPIQAKLAIENGFNVICEKPLSIKASDARELIEVSKAHRKKLFVVSQLRLYPAIQFIKQLITDRLTGTIYSFQINCFWNRNQNYYTDWRGSKEKDGGTLYTQFSHYIDLILWLFGSVKSQQMIHANLNHPQIEFEDSGTINFEMETGTIGNFSYSVNAHAGVAENSITILAQKTSLKLSGPMLDHFDYFYSSHIKPLSQEYPADKAHSHFSTYSEILKALNNEENNAVTAAESTPTIELIESIYNNC